jgi:hypothetical protein
MAAEILLMLALLAAGVAFSLLLWQAVQGEGCGETMDRRAAEEAVRRDQSDDGTSDEPDGWGAEARRDVRDRRN